MQVGTVVIKRSSSFRLVTLVSIKGHKTIRAQVLLLSSIPLYSERILHLPTCFLSRNFLISCFKLKTGLRHLLGFFAFSSANFPFLSMTTLYYCKHSKATASIFHKSQTLGVISSKAGDLDIIIEKLILLKAFVYFLQ